MTVVAEFLVRDKKNSEYFFDPKKGVLPYIVCVFFIIFIQQCFTLNKMQFLPQNLKKKSAKILFQVEPDKGFFYLFFIYFYYF